MAELTVAPGLWPIAVEGAVDRCAGRPIDRNPYSPEAPGVAAAWESGWRQADSLDRTWSVISIDRA